MQVTAINLWGTLRKLNSSERCNVPTLSCKLAQFNTLFSFGGLEGAVFTVREYDILFVPQTDIIHVANASTSDQCVCVL